MPYKQHKLMLLSKRYHCQDVSVPPSGMRMLQWLEKASIATYIYKYVQTKASLMLYARHSNPVKCHLHKGPLRTESHDQHDIAQVCKHDKRLIQSYNLHFGCQAQEMLKAGEVTGLKTDTACRAVGELQFWCCRLLKCPLVFLTYFLLLFRGEIVLQGNTKQR